MHHATATNKDGAYHALYNAFKACGFKEKYTPAKSSLTEYRAKVSYTFFEDIYRRDLERLNPDRRMFKGHYIYAVDGDQTDLPLSDDILDHGYRGYPVRGFNQETHFPKMYTVLAYDVMNGIVKDFRFSNQQHEVQLARQMPASLEENSITIYDRLHFNYETVLAHTDANNYFIARCKTGPNVKREVQAFWKSNKRSDYFLWSKLNKALTTPLLPVRLVKVKHPKTRKALVFMTNLDPKDFSNNEIAKLYLKRWEIEGCFRDLTSTMKMDEWRARTVNGILQEAYALLWLANAVKFQCLRVNENPDAFLSTNYSRSNFKLALSLVMENIKLLVCGQWRKLASILNYWIIRTQEKRQKLSRSYPRVHRKRGKPYGWANAVPRRP